MSKDLEQLEFDFGTDEIDFRDPVDDYSFSFSDSTMISASTVDTITIGSGSAYPALTTATMPSLNMASMPSITISPLTVGGLSNGVLTQGHSGPYWTNAATHNVMDVADTGKLSLRGKNADIDINGVSLMETLRTIQNQLNILRPNKELEADWDQLRELGEQYRRLEAEFAEKQKAWEALKQQG